MGAPRITDTTSGTATVEVGDTLVAVDGTWSQTPDFISRQWQRCSGSTCVPISGAVNVTYTPAHADVGQTIQLSEVPTYGPTALSSVNSSQTSTVFALLNLTAPTVSGTPSAGQTLTGAPGTWTNQPTGFNYQWQRCDTSCAPIANAIGSSYTLGAGDVGHTIIVSVSGFNGDGTGPTAFSSPTGLVTTTSMVSLVTSPVAPVVNQPVTLTATVSSNPLGGAPAGSVRFTNFGNLISGCPDQPVPPTGQSVSVSCQASFGAGSQKLVATFTPSVGSAVLGTSVASQTLAVGRDATTTALDVSPQVNIGAATTYTATVAPVRSGPVAPTGAVQFLADGRPIGGCAAQPLLGGGATCTVRYATAGRRMISARYLGDPNFGGSSSTAKPVRAVVFVKGAITATMQWTFHYTPSYTQVIAMVINGAPSGATVQTQCQGGGCPFTQRSATIGRPKPCKAKQTRSCPSPGTVDLSSTFRGHNLRAGAQITIMIRRPQYVGKYYRFTVRARRQPLVRIACLALDSTKPGVGCSST